MNLHDRLAVCSWSLQPESCEDLIEKLRACGISRTQLHLDPIAENAPGWDGALEKLQAEQIRPVSGMVMCVGEDYTTISSIERTGGLLPDVTWPVTRQRLRACAPLAAQLGLKLVSFHAGFIPAESGSIREKMLARVNETADFFAGHGCAIALETGQESADVLVGFLDELGREDIGVNFDPANMLLYGSGDPGQAMEQLGGRIRQVHLKDAIPSGKPGDWGSEVPVGEGEVDWKAFFAHLEKIGYEGDLPIEREAGDDRVGDIRKGVSFVESL